MTAFTVTLNDPSNLAGTNASNISACVQAACNIWGSYLQGFGNIDVQVKFASEAADVIASAGAGTYTYVDSRSSIDNYTAGTLAEIASGVDPNGSAADIAMTINTSWITKLFYDPSSAQPVPSNRTDAVSVFLHELTHGLGFLSFRNDDGSLPVDTASGRAYQALFDEDVTRVGGAAYFNGPNATRVYGGAVPLTNDGSYSHVGNSGGPGAELTSDLMAPAISSGVRRQISALDVAFLQDVGAPLATDRADTIILGSVGSTFMAFAGDDTISGGSGADVIYGNLGADVLSGNGGSDILYGGRDNDTVSGGDGNDIVYGNIGDDLLNGDEGNDLLYGGRGADVIYGGAGDDTLIGGLGNDTLVGGAGANLYIFGTNNGADLITGFSSSSGDRLDLQGQTYVLSDDGQGGTLLLLSGGGTVDLAGISSQSLTGAFVA